MKKQAALILVLVILQLIVLFGGMWISVSLRSDCSFPYGSSGPFGTWQCTGNADPTTIPTIVFVVVPPFLAYLIFKWLKYRISWKRIIISQVLVAAATYFVILYLSMPKCGCGGA